MAEESTRKKNVHSPRFDTKVGSSFWLRCKSRVTTNDLLLALVLTAVITVVGVGFGWENNKLVPANTALTAHYQAEPSNHLSFLANWDGGDYLSIAKHGYTSTVQTNFFPLFPLLVRWVTVVVRSPLLSGLLISWTCLVGALYFYLKIFKQLYHLVDYEEALKGVLCFLLFPTGVFLFVVYTESLFAFLALGAIYFALRNKYLPAALLCALATATHINGLFVVVFVALLLLEQKERLLRIASGMVIGVLGLLSYMLFLSIKFSNPLAFVVSQKNNGWLHYGFKHFLAELATRNGLFVLLVLISAVYWIQKRRFSFAVYSLLYLGIVLLGGLGAYGRYALADYPAQIMLYDYFRDKKLGFIVLIAFLGMFWMYFTLLFAAGYAGG